MKRTFWFGMIWTLAAVPLVAHALVSQLYICSPTSDKHILTNRAASIYGHINELYYNGSFDILIAASVLILGIGLILFIRKSSLQGGCWKYVREYPKGHPGGVPGIAARIAGIILAAAGMIFLLGERFFILNPGLDGFWINFNASVYWRVASIAVALSTIPPLVFIVSTFAYSIITSASYQEFRSKAAATSAGVLFLVLQLGALYYYQEKTDLGKHLRDVGGWAWNAEPRSVLILGKQVQALMMDDNYWSNRDYISEPEYEVPYNADNVSHIEKFVGGKGDTTYLSVLAYKFLVSSRFRDMDMAGARKVLFASFGLTGESDFAMLCLSEIRLGPASDDSRMLLHDLTDEKKYMVWGRAAMLVSSAYAKFGELDKARYWYEKGLSTSSDIPMKMQSNYKPPATPPYYSCKITGRICHSERPWQGVRVGLIRSKLVSGLSGFEKKEGEPTDPGMLFALTDGTTADASGRFTFDHLGEEEYVLLLSVDTGGGKKYKVLNSPGPLKVSEKNPTVDAGTINVVTVNY